MKMFKINFLFLLLISTVLSIKIDIRYPQFFHQSQRDSAIEITEGKSAGSFIAFVNLINYTTINLNEWNLETTDRDFQIQSNGISYSLITTKILDRERKKFYNFSIIAQHLTVSFEKISKTILIRILDLNDCTPSFNQSIYQTTLVPLESTFTVRAFDCDEINTDNSRISYSLSNYQDLFRINETTGTIECIKNMNTNERYEVIVVAFDHGKPSLSSTTLVQIQLISSKNEQSKSKSWIQIEQSPENLLILVGILAASFTCVTFSICFICFIKYKLKRRRNKDKDFTSNSSVNSSTDYQHTTIYDAVHTFPNTLYLPVNQKSEFNDQSTLQIPPPSSSTTSSPISAVENPIKIGSDDGCYCSSDMSSEQSNNVLLLNASKLSSKHVRFHENNPMDGVLQRFENLYATQTISDQCASYV